MLPLSTSVAGNPTLACTYALAELKILPAWADTSCSAAAGDRVDFVPGNRRDGCRGRRNVSITYTPTQGHPAAWMINGGMAITVQRFPIGVVKMKPSIAGNALLEFRLCSFRLFCHVSVVRCPGNVNYIRSTRHQVTTRTAS